MRALDDNERRYLALKWREERAVNRILAMGAVLVVLICLGALAMFLTFEVESPAGDAVVLVIAVSGMTMLLGLFGFIARARLSAWRAELPASPMAYVINGPFWEETSARTMTRFGIGDSYVAVPPHWLRLLRGADATRVLTAEVVDGPAESVIVLSINDTLSVSREVDHGLLSVRASFQLVVALFALMGLVLAGLGALVVSDDELTLWRYIEVGPRVSRFSSVAELRRARPPAFGHIALTGLALLGGEGDPIAVDPRPADEAEAARMTQEARRIAREIRDYPCAQWAATCKADERERHAEAMAGAAEKVFDDAAGWARRLQRAAAEGLILREQDRRPEKLSSVVDYFQAVSKQLGTEGERAGRRREHVAESLQNAERMFAQEPAARSPGWQAMLKSSARGVDAERSESDLLRTLENVDQKIGETTQGLAARLTLQGILYRMPSVGQWLECNKRYSVWALGLQALVLAFGLVIVLFTLLSRVVVARSGRALRTLIDQLPPSL